MSQQHAKSINTIAESVKTGSNANSEMKRLADNFEPSAKDVICKRGKTAYNHNKHFRDLLTSLLDKYSAASSKLEKSLVVSEVVDTIREGSPEGGFVRCLDGVWYEVGDSIAREKCGGTFRDMLHTQYRSSTKAKKRRRQEQEAAAATTATVVSSNNSVKTSESSSKKRRRVNIDTTDNTPIVPAISPASATKVMCAFGDLLKDIASRKQELTVTTLPALETMKKPALPPPIRFPSAPKVVSVTRGCSVESTLSFDIEEMEEMDEFELGLARFTSVASVPSLFSYNGYPGAIF